MIVSIWICWNETGVIIDNPNSEIVFEQIAYSLLLTKNSCIVEGRKDKVNKDDIRNTDDLKNSQKDDRGTQKQVTGNISF